MKYSSKAFFFKKVFAGTIVSAILVCGIFVSNGMVLAAANPNSISVGSQNGVLTYGTAGSATYSISASGSGNGNTTWSIVSGLPSGATASFSPNPSSGNGSWASSLRINTTASTPAGTFSTIIVKAAGNNSATTTAILVIGKMAVTVTAGAKTKVYGDPDPALTYSVTSGSLSAGDSFSGSLTRAAGENVGTHAIQKGSLALGSSYDLTYVGADLTVTTRTLAVSASGGDKTYDGTTAATVVLSDDRVAGDSLSVGYTSASFGDKNTGTNKTIAVNGISVSGASSGNYTWNSSTSSLASITAKNLTVSATGIGKVYDGTVTANVSLASSDIVTGDAVNLTANSSVFDDPNAGAGKPVHVTGIAINGSDSSNYNLTNTAAETTADIAQNSAAVSMVSGQDLIRSYNGNPQGLDFETDPSGLSLSVSYNGFSGAPTDAGTYVVVANVSDPNYIGSDTHTLTINPIDQTITFGSLSDKKFGDSDFTVPASASSGLTVNFVASGQCTVSGYTVHLTGAGSCVLTASQDGGGNYNPAAPIEQSFNIAVGDQTISIITSAPTSAVYGKTFNVVASSSSALDVAITSSGSCSGGGSNSATLAMTSGVGICTVYYNQAGSADYHDAPQITENTAAAKADQTITFDKLPGKTYGDSDFTVSVSSTSGLSVGLSASTSSNCTVSGYTVHLTGAGSCVLTASQDGDTDYNPAASVDQSFAINSAKLIITANNATKSYGNTLVFAGTEFTTSGLVSGDSVVAVTLTSTGTIAIAPISGSPYAIIPTNAVGTNLIDNYNITYENGQLTVKDETPPVIEKHATVSADLKIGTDIQVAYDSPTGTDDVDGPVPVTCVPPSGSSFSIGDTIVVCTATDSSNNQATSTFAVHVNDKRPTDGGGAGVGGGTFSFSSPIGNSNTANGGNSNNGNVSGGNSPAGKVLGASTYKFTFDLSLGMQGEAVIELQKRLIAEGFLAGEPTEHFGQLTFQAVKAYQAKHGVVPITGYVGPKTRAVLNGSSVFGSVTSIQEQLAALQIQFASLLAEWQTIHGNH